MCHLVRYGVPGKIHIMRLNYLYFQNLPKRWGYPFLNLLKMCQLTTNLDMLPRLLHSLMGVASSSASCLVCAMCLEDLLERALAPSVPFPSERGEPMSWYRPSSFLTLSSS